MKQADIIRLLRAIVQTKEGRFGQHIVTGDYSIGGEVNDRVLIAGVYNTFNQMPGAHFSLAQFKDLIREAWSKKLVSISTPKAIATTGFITIDEHLIKDSRLVIKVPGKYGKSEWYSLDIEPAQKALLERQPTPVATTGAPTNWKPMPEPGPSKKNAPILPAALPGAIKFPLTANDQFLDAMIRHQVYLLRLSKGTQNKVIDLLRKNDKELRDRIRAAFQDPWKVQTITPAARQRLVILRDYLNSARGKTWDDVNKIWLEDIMSIANRQPELLAGMLKTVSPVQLDFILPAPEMLETLVTHTPFEGRILHEWAASMKATEIKRIEDQIQIGMVQGETVDQIARRVVGSFELGGVDGVTEMSRRNATAITRTAINSIANAVNRAFFIQNKQYFQGERFVATLDSRTTPRCRAMDGKVFPVGEGPIPPLHWNCRSIRVVTLDGEALGMRPARNFTEQSLLREFTDEEGIDSVTFRDGLPRGYKGAFDKFVQKRTRELTGQVAADVDYGTWLARQPKQFQDDILGVTKGALFRTGKLPLDRFLDSQLNELSLDELARLHADVFRAAGLNPADFL